MVNLDILASKGSKIHWMKSLTIPFVLLAMLVTACGSMGLDSTPSSSSSPLPLPSETPTQTSSPQQPTQTATFTPVDGTLTIKVNVRSGPGTSFDSLGQLDAGERIQITARDSQVSWYQIIYPSTSQGLGWVAAQYVLVTPGTDIRLDSTPTLAGPAGSIIQRLNVRSGPGTTFELLGLLEPGSLVSLTGKNSTSSWFQIYYPASSSGVGWVTSQFVQTDATANLPVLDEYGFVITPGSVGNLPLPILSPTPTVGPALLDGDSGNQPAISVHFSASGTHQFVYSSQVSSPVGDVEDWIEFIPYTLSGPYASMTISLTCEGNSTLVVELWQTGALLSSWGSLICNEMGINILLAANQPYSMRLSPIPGNGLRLVAYQLTIKNNP
jgi:uncharacterized protein YgiM (DUF1202 family)